MNTTGHFLLSTMQGPMAANAAVNVWSQYLGRIASYGCMVFGICNTRVVYENEAAKVEVVQPHESNLWLGQNGIVPDNRLDARHDGQE